MTRIASRMIEVFSSTSKTRFFEPAEFPWTEGLEADWKLIRSELDRIVGHLGDVPAFEDLSSSQKHITSDKRWKTYFFRSFSSWVESSCAECPETFRLLKTIPGLQSAFFSIFEAGKHLPEHRGPYNGVLRYHLGLLVPEPAEQCAIRVGTEVRHWTEGKSIIFDDFHPHEAWNRTDGVRVVLFLDFERPLPWPVAMINRLTMAIQARTAFAAELRQNQQAHATRQMAS